MAKEIYLFSRTLNTLRDKLLSRRVDGKLFQIDSPWNAKLRCPVDILILGNWIYRVDADRAIGTLRCLGVQIRSSSTMDIGHTSTRAERSWRWLCDILEDSGNCVVLASYGQSVELLTLTEPQCSGLIVVVSTDYLLLLPIRHCSNLVGSEQRQEQVPSRCHLLETAWWPVAVTARRLEARSGNGTKGSHLFIHGQLVVTQLMYSQLRAVRQRSDYEWLVAAMLLDTYLR